MYFYPVLCWKLYSFPQNAVENYVEICAKLWIYYKTGYEQSLSKEVSFIGKIIKIIHRKPVDNCGNLVENPVLFCGLVEIKSH